MSGLADRTDLAGLLTQCSRGHGSAFAGFYDATAPRAWGLAFRVVRNRAQTEEVLQEAYLTAWRQSGRYDPARGKVSSWFLTIVHRAAVDRVRSSEASSRRDHEYAAQAYASPETDPTADAAHSSFEAHRAREAMQSLTHPQRQAVELAYWGGHTHTQVAEILKIPLGTAKTRIRDGLLRLRDAFEAIDQRSAEPVGT